MEERLSASVESRKIVDSADSSGSPGESGPVGRVPEHQQGRAEYWQDQDIVQHSASEQTPMSLCIWYSKPM